ncbi:MAG: histidine ammonia-lyase [Deltaproteobacteria bacterium]|nr:MAG: histidine ammonia-lyase [Deltaproteobacteria bacterium]
MVRIDGNSLTINEVTLVSREGARAALHEAARPRMEKSRAFVRKILDEGRTVYGINTGVGELANQSISREEVEKLQHNLIRSHATNVGLPFPEDVVRGIILLRANALAKGFSGVRVRLVETLLALLNHRVYPYIPCQGSVGASGDLSPLAHLGLVLTGEGECIIKGQRVPSEKVLQDANIEPLSLQAKEGLALINGTQVMAALACLVTTEASMLMKNAQVAGAMSLEALKGTSKAFDEKIHQIRPHPGQLRCAANMRTLVSESEIIASHKNCEKVQDAYTLRCIPQVYGPILETIDYARKVLEVEINSATDNPLVFPDEEKVISGGNFHGEPLAFVMDYLGIALAEIGDISERTIDRLVNPHVSGLPPFLAHHSGLNSGFMISQYTAASLVSENKVLAHPASVDSIPTSAGQEDHVSMGSISARHAWDILHNVEYVLSIEMLTAAQGIDFHPFKPGKGTGAAHRIIRKHIPHLDEDRPLYRDIEKVREMVVSGEIVHAVEQAVGPLQ